LLKIENNLRQLKSVYYTFAFININIVHVMLSLESKTDDNISKVEGVLLEAFSEYLPEFSFQVEREFTAEWRDDMHYAVLLDAPTLGSVTPIYPDLFTEDS